MKIQTQKVTGPSSRVYALSYELKESITATHFKALMFISKYDSANKTGLVAARNEKAFLALVVAIEESDSTEAETSHAKSVVKAAAKKSVAKLSFNDYCEDHLGTRPSMMSAEEITEARASFYLR